MTPLTLHVAAVTPLRRVGRLRRLWYRHGPLLPIAFGAGMIVGSWLAYVGMGG